MRNLSIEFAKVIAAIAVVMIHAALFFKANDINSGLIWFCSVGTAFAVPFFIFLSGFYMEEKNIKIRTNNYILQLVKLYVLVQVIITILNFISINFIGDIFTFSFYTQWYFLAMITILILTINRNKYWLFSMFLFSFLFSLFSNTLIPDLFSKSEIIINTHNTFISFLWVFILGSWLHKYIQKTNKNIGIMFFVIFFIFELLNYYIFEMPQFSIIPIAAGICLFIGSYNYEIMVDKNKIKILNYIYLDVFLYHVVFIGIFYNSFIDYNLEYANLLLMLFVVISFIGSIIFGQCIRYIDKNLFNSIIFKE